MEAAARHAAAIKYLRRYPVRSLVLRRAIILGLFSLAVASAACVLFGAAGVGLLWGSLALKYPGDPSILDTVIWGLVFATPMLAIFLPMIGLTAGAITYFIVRRRYDRRKSN